MADAPVYSTRFRIIAGLVVAAAAGAFTLAYLSTREGGEDPIVQSGEAGEYVEALLPQRNAQVPQQATVGIDLDASWTGALVVNGTEIPPDELQVTDELGLVQFTPGDGRAVEELRGGTNTVTAVVWPRSESRDAAGVSVTWTFTVV